LYWMFLLNHSRLLSRSSYDIWLAATSHSIGCFCWIIQGRGSRQQPWMIQQKHPILCDVAANQISYEDRDSSLEWFNRNIDTMWCGSRFRYHTTMFLLNHSRLLSRSSYDIWLAATSHSIGCFCWIIQGCCLDPRMISDWLPHHIVVDGSVCKSNYHTITTTTTPIDQRPIRHDINKSRSTLLTQ
jgi:hypothetical protein